MGPRAGLSTVLVLGALVLLAAIALGTSMGNRVLGQIAGRAPAFATTPLPSPTASAADNSFNQILWKRRQVLSVATDPAFPDPRITPEPEVPATPRPRSDASEPAKKKPAPSPSPTPPPAVSTPHAPYTSPPMPIPLVTHGGTQSAAPDPETSAGAHSSPSPSPRPVASGHAGAAASGA